MGDEFGSLGRRETDAPSSIVLEMLMEAMRQAEEQGWHHCPRGTREGDHYDALVEAYGKSEERDQLWSHKEDVGRPEGLGPGVGHA